MILLHNLIQKGTGMSRKANVTKVIRSTKKISKLRLRTMLPVRQNAGKELLGRLVIELFASPAARKYIVNKIGRRKQTDIGQEEFYDIIQGAIKAAQAE